MGPTWTPNMSIPRRLHIPNPNEVTKGSAAEDRVGVSRKFLLRRVLSNSRVFRSLNAKTNYNQGSIGLAAGAFVEGLEGEEQHIWHTTHDPLHRLIRDCKNTAHTCNHAVYEYMQAKTGEVTKQA